MQCGVRDEKKSLDTFCVVGSRANARTDICGINLELDVT